MTLWLRRTQGLDSTTMREIADVANVEWDFQRIVYQAKGIGYADGDKDDLESIQDAAKDVFGYQPQLYEPLEQDGEPEE